MATNRAKLATGKKRPIAWFLVVACLFGISWIRQGSAALESATDRLIQSLQWRASMYPQDPAVYNKLGAAYIQKGRETGDASYYELARQALSKSLELVSSDPTAASAKTHMALVFMAEHRFHDALEWAEAALELGSGDPTPWGTLGDALADMGEYDQAEAAYARLRDPVAPDDSANALASTRDARLSYIRFLRGDRAGAGKLMRRAIQAAVASHLPAENIAWESYQLGDELFRGGNFSGAASAYRQGLEVAPGNYRCLAGMAQVRAAEEQFPEAIELYKKALGVVPFPEYAAALGDIYARTGRAEEARKQYDLVEFMGYLNTVNKTLYNRELALFYADHEFKLKESLKLARKELEVRHDLYTWDTLAWSLYKNGRSDEAAGAIAKALRLGTRDGQLFFHGAMIYDRMGDKVKSRQYQQNLSSMNPRFQAYYSREGKMLLAGTN